MKSALVEAESHHLAHQRRPQPSAALRRGDHDSPEHADAVIRQRGQHHMADEVPALPLHRGERHPAIVGSLHVVQQLLAS